MGHAAYRNGLGPDRGDRLFTPGFRAIVASQVFSLLGIEILQFVLPLHLLNLTGSGTLYGMVLAAGFIPYVGLSPVGGILADRTRKRKVMMTSDALLALVMAGYLALASSEALVPLTVGVLMIAFAAQAIYHPCVQSAVPLVVASARITQATAVANQVSMITGIAGPVVGGLIFGFFGLVPIVAAAAASFAVSCALVALFVRIPYEPPARTQGVVATAVSDIRDAVGFMRSRPVLWQTVAAATLVNLFGASFINVGTPYVVTETLGLSNQLMGVAQGALAVGGLAGGCVVALMPGRFGIYSVPRLLAVSVAGLLVMAGALAARPAPLPAFAAIVAGVMWIMACCTALSIAVTSHLQREAPAMLVGKVMALAMTAANLATPAGQMVYGVMFDQVPGWVPALLAAAAMAAVAAALARALARQRR